METRILREVEEMISKVREEQGRPFDVKLLTTTCVANVVMDMMFGRRFDHSDPAFQRLMSEFHKFFANFPFNVEVCRALRFLPHVKRRLAEFVTTTKNILRFMDNSISTCVEVSGFVYCVAQVIGVASYGALGHVPPRLPASYFGDHSLYRL